MIRVLFALVLVFAVAGVAFYAGRASVESEMAAKAGTSQPVQPPSTAPGGTTPAEEQRSRTGEYPQPPQVALNPPSLEQPPIGDRPAEPASPGGAAAAAPTRAFEGRIGLPIAKLKPSDLIDTFDQSRGQGERRHGAVDIMAPRGTPVIAVDSGIIQRLFNSKPGGLTIYQFDSNERNCYYYAHLDRYASGVREGLLVKRGDLIGYVGSTGNADPAAPHLHFAVFELGPDKRWWEGTPVNPIGALRKALGK